jgi:rubrerythrin
MGEGDSAVTEKLDGILDYAIEREKDAYDFYMDLAGRASRPEMRETFASFAKEELGHKKKLEAIKAERRGLSRDQEVLDLKIADYVVDVQPSPELGYQEALILAMKREKAAFRLYSALADMVLDREMQVAFRALAQEEAKHKLRFEVEYDEVILAEN